MFVKNAEPLDGKTNSRTGINGRLDVMDESSKLELSRKIRPKGKSIFQSLTKNQIWFVSRYGIHQLRHLMAMENQEDIILFLQSLNKDGPESPTTPT